MNASNYRITLDIKSIQSQIAIPFKQGDTKRRIYISLVDGGEPYIIGEECFALIEVIKPDGTKIGNSCYIENNRIVYLVTEQTVAASGVANCEVSLYDTDGGLITSPRFTLLIDPKIVGEDDFTSSSEYTALTECLMQVKAGEEERQAKWNAVLSNPKVWELEDGCYYVSGYVQISPSLVGGAGSSGFYVYDKTLLYVATDNTDEKKKHFVLFLGYAFDAVFDIVTGTTDGTDSEFHVVETDKNKVYKIDKNSTDDQYPTAKAVYEALLAQAIDIKIEPIGEEAQPTTYAMRSVPDMASASGVTVKNYVVNSNFASADNWSGITADTLTIADGKATVYNADGSKGTINGIKQNINAGERGFVIGDKWFVKVNMSVQAYTVDNGAVMIPQHQIYINNGGLQYAFNFAPVVKGESFENVDKYGILTAGANVAKADLYARVQYTKPEYATGKTTVFKNIVAVNLTEVYGEGNEPTADEFYTLLSTLDGAWFDGTTTLYEDTGDSGDNGNTGDGGDSGDSGNDNPGGNTPIVSGSGYKLIITTAEGTETLYLYQGQKGEDGKDGTNGKDGKNGADGVSPTINVEEFEGGNRLTITDKNGEKTIDLMNAPPIDTEAIESIGDAIGENTHLEDITDTLTIETGAISQSSGAISSAVTNGQATLPFEVKEGEVYHIWGSYNRVRCLIALYDENKKFIAPVFVSAENPFTKVENEIYTIPATAADSNGNERNVAYMACSTGKKQENGVIDVCVKKEITKYNNLSETVSNVIEDSFTEKLDKVLCSPNGSEWVLTISNDGVITAIPRRDVSDSVNTELTLPDNLPIGTYTLKYESINGVLTDYAEICSLEVTSEENGVSYNGLIAENCSPKEAKCIGVYNSSNERVGEIDLGFLSTKYSSKRYSFAALSDVHIGDKENFPAKFETAIDGIDGDEDISFSVICGDMVDDATDETQLATYHSIVKDLNKPVYVTMGNHEMVNAVVAGMTFDDIKEAFKQDKYDINQDLYFSFSPEGSDDVFIMFSISGNYMKYTALSIEQLQWLYETLEKNRNKRCFLFHHYFPWDGSGDAVDCYTQNGLQGTRGDVFYSLLKHYKNVIYFHGHTHAKFKIQELNSMNTIDNIFGRYSVNVPSLTCPTDTNADKNAYVEDSNAGEGYIVDVYENGIALRGKDFVNGVFLPIGSYFLDTVIQKVEANTYCDPTGTIDTPMIKV